ncbi:hypothetical protein [Actinomadura sp. GTD37]|uniref:hypothetical protein n=1 Tax=Actinomadura sp. GTD37 TaxID=1778030 RepID=UPI0035BFAEB5
MRLPPWGEITVRGECSPGRVRAPQPPIIEDARAALTTACADVLTISAAELADKLATIHDGILVDDDLDTGLLTAISALGHWQSYPEQNRRGELYELAIRSIEDVDHEVSADLDDFLATPEMAAEYDRIRRLLAPGTVRGRRNTPLTVQE